MNVGLLQDLFVQGFFNWPLMYGLRHVGRVKLCCSRFQVFFFFFIPSRLPSPILPKPLNLA